LTADLKKDAQDRARAQNAPGAQQARPHNMNTSMSSGSGF